MKKETYMVILEGTFSEDMITTGTSFQEDPYKQCQKEGRMRRKKEEE